MAKGMSRSLALQKFAEMENVEVSDADVTAEIERMMENASDKGLRKFFDTPSARESLSKNLLIRKMLDRLVEIVTGEEPSAVIEKETEKSAIKEEESENGDTTE